jgi:glucose/arabinose dehydrogenase
MMDREEQLYGFHPRLTRAAPAWGMAVLGALLVSCAPAAAQVKAAGAPAYRVTTVAEGLEHPWGMAFLPGGDILVTERPGRLRLIRGGARVPEPVAGVPEVWAREQGGLMDVALHPDFARNRLVYLSYSKPGPKGATTAVARGRLEGNRLSGVQEILEAKAWSRGGDHFGSRLAFDREGYLFVSVGERGRMQNAQDLKTHAGKILRLHDDGRVPRDNPFVGRPDALPEIYAYGVRNPQGLAVHPETGELWETEHGPRGGDELNRIRPGRNYGWPVVTYGIDYSGGKISALTRKEGMEQPVRYWVPSIGTSGLAIYAGDRFPGWRGSVFIGGLTGRHLARVRLEGGRPVAQEKLLGERGERIRDVRVGPDGYLYVLVDNRRAPLLRLEPAR